MMPIGRACASPARDQPRLVWTRRRRGQLMATKLGLVLAGDHPLDSVLRPLAPYLTRCHWIIDDQSGPFDSSWMYESPENEELLDRESLDVLECENTSTTCWRPRTLPRLAAHLVVDEWTYFFAID